jgi:hypothetical protein
MLQPSVKVGGFFMPREDVVEPWISTGCIRKSIGTSNVQIDIPLIPGLDVPFLTVGAN